MQAKTVDEIVYHWQGKTVIVRDDTSLLIIPDNGVGQNIVYWPNDAIYGMMIRAIGYDMTKGEIAVQKWSTGRATLYAYWLHVCDVHERNVQTYLDSDKTEQSFQLLELSFLNRYSAYSAYMDSHELTYTGWNGLSRG